MKVGEVEEDKVTETEQRDQEAELLLREKQPNEGEDGGASAGSPGEKLDGGWGWCVVIAGATCLMLLVTQGPCFGVLYGRRLQEIGASPSLATWIFNIQSLIWNLSGPWAGPLTELASYRTIAAAGSLLVASSLFISPLVTNPNLLLVTFSTTVGIGGGLTVVSVYHMTSRYFNKRLGLANGFVMAGGSLGLILMPQLTSLLQENFPFLWASFITGAVVLHAPAMALLLHPVSWHCRAANPAPQFQQAKPDAVDKRLESSKQGMLRGASVPADLLKLGGGLKIDAVRPGRFRTGSECHHDSLWLEKRGSAFRLGGSTLIAGSILTLQSETITREEQQKEIQEQPSALKRVWRKFRSQYNVQLMKDPLATGIALATCCTITSVLNIIAIIPFVLAEANYTLQDTATAMSVAAMMDLFTRLLGAAITDCPMVDVRLLYYIGQLIYIVVPYVLMRHTGEWGVVLACMVALGVGLGITYMLDVLLLVRALGAHRMAAVLGLSQFFRCLAFAIMGPIGGQLREVTGTFLATLTFLSGTVAVGLLLLTLAIFTSIDRRGRLAQSQTKA